MKYAAILILFAVLLSACEKDDDNNTSNESELPYGLYRGTFHRTGMDTANVSLNIQANYFEGSSEAGRFYPAICRGSYTIDRNGIQFQDSCAWQANFDWTLILNGRFELSKNGNEVRLKRENGRSTDEYQLTRMAR